MPVLGGRWLLSNVDSVVLHLLVNFREAVLASILFK